MVEQLKISRKDRKFFAILFGFIGLLGFLTNIFDTTAKGLASAYISCICIGLSIGILFSLTNLMEIVKQRAENSQ